MISGPIIIFIATVSCLSMCFPMLHYLTLFLFLFLFLFSWSKGLGLIFHKGQSIHTFYCDDDMMTTKALKQTLNICSYFVSLYIAMNCAFFFVTKKHSKCHHFFCMFCTCSVQSWPETNKDLFILSLECAALVDSLWFT